ncbi:hypothetical protein XENOCAPTIV_022653, partial [Xenoophorus captivus]
ALKHRNRNEASMFFFVSDYELQVSLSEALCRLTPRREREQRANQWFSSSDISSAFCDIRDADFEVKEVSSTGAGGAVQASPSVDKHVGRSYSRKKPPSKSQLKTSFLPQFDPTDSYLSDQTEGVTPHKRKAEPRQTCEESYSPIRGVEQAAEEVLHSDGVWPNLTREKAEPESHLTSDITSTFKSFKTQLEQRFIVCRHTWSPHY